MRADKARTAVFYSISNCQRGLAGVSFGNFLIKQVVEEVSREIPEAADLRDAVAGAGLCRLAQARARRGEIRGAERGRQGRACRARPARLVARRGDGSALQIR